jgi:hypothetical protein
MVLNKRLTYNIYGVNNSQHIYERSYHMPGSYFDPRSYANSAIQILEEAYEESQGTHAGTLILQAIDAITRLKDEIKESSRQRLSELDSYEFNDSNLAV